MRKGIILAATMLFVLAIGAQAKASTFDSFNQNIKVNQNGTFNVTETVMVNFDEMKHGIFRDIPVRYKTDAGNPFSIKIKVISVTDLGGISINYTVSQNGDNERIQIGDADKLITGKQTYVISYEVSRALLFLKDQDQLYWNVSTEPWGDLGWPIAVSATVTLPSSVPQDKIQARCFTELGVGAPEDCNILKSDNVVVFKNSQASFGDSVLTIVVGWPKGVVSEPTGSQKFWIWLSDNWIIFLPIIVFIFMFWCWYKYGRDPKMSGSIVVEYEPPENAAPAELLVLEKGRGGMPEISATIVHLAVKGYLVIEESEKKNIIGSSRSYVFELKKEFASDASLADFERMILDNIFTGQIGERVGLADLENKFYTALPGIKSSMSDAAVKRGWYKASPTRVRGVYFGAAGTYVFIAFFLLRLIASLSSGPTVYISLFAPAVIIAFFGYFMPARTAAGNAAYLKTLGFKEFIGKAEKYRAKWEEKENIFSDYLPYAMIFGVADKWAKAFEGLEKNPPSWYRGAPGLMWSPLFFASSMTNAASSFGHSLAVAPSARGGGGFGGGGFGGGGFGGGGGGSW
jgi:Predicted membrane protein (DUF2207)